jgi:Tfp pilus assembly ATPase PilU
MRYVVMFAAIGALCINTVHADDSFKYLGGHSAALVM